MRRRRLCGAALALAGVAASSGPAWSATPDRQGGVRLDVGRTALLLIDFQESNAAVAFKPHGFADTVAHAARLSAALRAAGGLVIHTHVLEQAMLALPADKPLPAGAPKPGGADLVAGLQPEPGDVVVTKRQWGSYYGTDLDQQLRRRDVRTLLIAGVATEVGVESTAREAYDRGYALVFIEDAISGATDGTDEMFMRTLFPRMGMVRSSADVIAAIQAAQPPQPRNRN